MGLFRTIRNLVKPRKAEFIKRLVAKRLDSAPDRFLAHLAPEGTAQYQMRRFRLEAAEFAVSPEATIANVLEKYWEPHVHWFYSQPIGLSHFASDEQKVEESKLRTEKMICHIEYLLTGKPDAATHLPAGLDLPSYIRYRITVEHPGHKRLEEYGITDDLINYAIAESKYVFGR